jgi:hypothetical protein
MAEINQFNSLNLRQLRASLDSSLKDIEKEYGVTISLGTMRFSSDETNVKLTVRTKEGIINQQDFPNSGVKFTANGVIYTVVDFKPKSYKYPYVGVDQKGKRYKFSEETIIKNKITN